MVSDITFPSKLSIDPDSFNTCLRAVAKNSFCGLLSCPDGVIYLVPYRPKDTSEVEYPYPKEVKVAGKKVLPIVHAAGGMAGHDQLAICLTNSVGIKTHGFVGFSLLFDSDKGGLGGTSRSQNNQHFREWSGGNQDTAFADYHERREVEEEEGRWVRVQGPPEFQEVTNSTDGELPAQWKDQLKSYLVDKLPRWASCLKTGDWTALANNAPSSP